MRVLFSLILFAFCINSQAQLSVGYYPYPYSKVEMTSNPNAVVFGGIRVQTNSFASNLNTDFNFCWNFKRQEQINFFAGLGARINLTDFGNNDINAYKGQYLMLGARFYPFEKLTPLGLSFDICPYAEGDFKSGRLESNLGLFWSFGR